MKDAHARRNVLSGGGSGGNPTGFDFMEDRPLHARVGGGGRRPIVGSGGGGGGRPSAPARLSAHGESRVASLFDLLQRLSVPPTPQSSSHGGAQAPEAPGALPSPAVSSSASEQQWFCSEGTGRTEQPQQQQQQQRQEVSSQERERRGATGGGGPADGGIAPRLGPLSGSAQQRQQQRQQQQHRQEALATSGDSYALPLPPRPRPALRKVRHVHNQQGVSQAEPARRVTFFEESENSHRLGIGAGSSSALRGRDHDHPCRVSHLAGARGGGGSGGSDSNAGKAYVRRNSETSHPAQGAATKRKPASLGTIEPDNSNAHGATAPSVTRPPAAAGAAAAAATTAGRTGAAAGSTTTTQPRGFPDERPARRRRVDGGGRRLGSGGNNNDGSSSSSSSSSSGGGESAKSASVGRWSAPPSGGRRESNDGRQETNVDGDAALPPPSSRSSSRFSSTGGSPSPSSCAQGGTGGEDRGGGGGRISSTPNAGGHQEEEGIRGPRAAEGQELVDKGFRSSWRRVPVPRQETDEAEALQWMTQGPDPAAEEAAVYHQDGGSRWSSPKTASDSSGVCGGRGRGRGGDARGSNRTVLRQRQEEEEEQQQQEGGTVDRSSSDPRRHGHASPRNASRRYDEGIGGTPGRQDAGGLSRPAGPEEASPPGRAAGEEAKKRAMGVADDEDSSSSGDEGYTFYDGGDQDGEGGGTGGESDHQVQEKKMLGVCGLCQMKGTLLAMVDWGTADGGTERTIMPTSELKAEWPRQYIAYLEGKVVFAAEDGGTAPDPGKDEDAGY